MKIAILMMAAGFGRRFRQSGGGHKLLASLSGKPVLQHSLEQATATGLDVFVVTRPEDVRLHALIGTASARAVLCHSEGIGDSIAAGVRASADYDGWLITLADMPFLRGDSLLAVADALSDAPLARAEFNGQPGHPVGFQRRFYQDLTALKGDTGARALLKGRPCRAVSLIDRGCVWDIDSYADLDAFNATMVSNSR